MSIKIKGKFETANKRKHSFWNNEMPLTSKRARYIISSEIESEKLAKAIRVGRAAKNAIVKVYFTDSKFIINDKNVISQFEKMK